MTEQNGNNMPVDPQQPAPQQPAPQQPVNYGQQEPMLQQPAPQQPAPQQPVNYGQQEPMPQQPAPQQPAPQQPAPQQPAPQQGGYQPQANYGQQQGGYQPQAGYAAAPVKPNAIVECFKALPEVLMHIWNGKTSEVFSAISAQKLFGPVMVGVYITIVSLVSAVALARLPIMAMLEAKSSSPMALLASLADDSYFHVSFGTWFVLFIMLLVVGAIGVTLRPLAIMLTLKLRGISIGYMRSMRLYSVAVLPLMSVLPLFFLVSLLPSNTFVSFLELVVTILLCIAAVVGELLVYIGINREGKMEVSPVLPYATLTVLWSVVFTLLIVLLIRGLS